MDEKVKLKNAWGLIDELADEFTKRKFELDDILYDISVKIFEYRINNNLTTEQLAKKLGTTPRKIEELESGLYDFSISELWWIAKKLNWNLEIKFLDSWIEL
ncbi:helix-turn-helix transcriptional regulator [Paraclostridium dentum]|uniref:helix-turn-helix transcriptional regulator n=1 Tax=Paraclostridium dentum TaxID=2662455 RepID=UPI00346404BF